MQPTTSFYQVFPRAVQAEALQLRYDRGGHMIVLVTMFCAVAWSAGISNLLAGYGGADANPSERAAVSGVFQLAVLGLFVWVARNVLREEATEFVRLKLLSLPNRAAIWTAKWVCLSVAGVGVMLAAMVLSTITTLGSLAIAGRDWHQFVGSDAQSYVTLAGNTILVTLVSISFAVALSILCNSLATAITAMFGWVLVVEGMIDGSNSSMAFFYSLLPFKNATRIFEQSSSSKFVWGESFSILYSLGLSVAIASTVIFLNRSKIDRSSKE